MLMWLWMCRSDVTITVVNFMLVVYREYNDQLSWTMGIHVTRVGVKYYTRRI